MMDFIDLDNPVSPVPALISLLTALLTAAVLQQRFGVAAAQGRYSSIDGLRGFLAFMVFLHHAVIWFFYLRSAKWELPPSNLFIYFGQGSVGFFFMITGFLFFSKLLDGRRKPVDWFKLFVSRIFRLVPMYLFSVFLLLVIVVYASDGILKEPLIVLVNNIINWVVFTIQDAPDLNGVKNTYVVVAGVFWSLPYEWLFYLCLPILSIILMRFPPMPYLVLSLFCLAVFLYVGSIEFEILMPFGGGILAAFLVRSKMFCEYATNKLASCLVIGCVAAAVAFYDSAWTIEAVVLLSTAFVFIACGNTLFGILVHPVSRVLGEMAYSVYLLHGMILFVLFNYVIGRQVAAEFSALTHWLWIIGITPLVVVLSFTTFQLIESPGMRVAPAASAWLRAKAQRLNGGVTR